MLVVPKDDFPSDREFLAYILEHEPASYQRVKNAVDEVRQARLKLAREMESRRFGQRVGDSQYLTTTFLIFALIMSFLLGRASGMTHWPRSQRGAVRSLAVLVESTVRSSVPTSP